MKRLRHSFFTRSRPVVGLSACLAGEAVRYDGTHRRDRWIMRSLARHADLVPLCPEAAIGLGVPRPAIRLVGDPRAPRIVGVADPGRDVTELLRRFGARVAGQYPGLCGYVFKSRSPSCGVWTVPVHRAGGIVTTGRGGFAAALMDGLPQLPVVEEEGLTDPARRDNFVECIFACLRWHEFSSQRPTASGLVAFHTAHKLQLLAHGRSGYRALGRLVARAGTMAPSALVAAYGARFMAVLSVPAARGGHVDALEHAAGFLKRSLDASQRAELKAAIAAYRLGAASWRRPAALLRRHVRRLDEAAWIARQVYLDPAPGELALRNFAGRR